MKRQPCPKPLPAGFGQYLAPCLKLCVLSAYDLTGFKVHFGRLTLKINEMRLTFQTLGLAA